MRYLLVLCFTLIAAFSFAQDGRGNIQTTAPLEIRAAAILTTSDVLSTTFTIAERNRAKAIHYYVDFTKGSLTSASIVPAGAAAGNPAASGYYKSTAVGLTVNADGKYHMRLPVTEDGGAIYHGVFVKGEGTATGSSATVKYKLEY